MVRTWRFHCGEAQVWAWGTGIPQATRHSPNKQTKTTPWVCPDCHAQTGKMTSYSLGCSGVGYWGNLFGLQKTYSYLNCDSEIFLLDQLPEILLALERCQMNDCFHAAMPNTLVGLTWWIQTILSGTFRAGPVTYFCIPTVEWINEQILNLLLWIPSQICRVNMKVVLNWRYLKPSRCRKRLFWSFPHLNKGRVFWE